MSISSIECEYERKKKLFFSLESTEYFPKKIFYILPYSKNIRPTLRFYLLEF
jgi:hypothetical protein